MYFLAPPSSCKQIIVPLKHSSMLPQNKNRLIFGRPKESWHWTICHSLPLPSKHLCFSKTSWRRLQHNNSLSSKTPSGRVCNTSSTNAFKTSSRCLQDVFARRLQDVFKTCFQDVFFKSSWRGLQDIFMKTSCSYVLKTYVLKDKKMLYWRRLQYVFTKTNVWWVSLSGLSVVVCSVILHRKHSRSSSSLCWSLRKATSCEHNNSKYGQGKSGPTSQRTVCRQYVASAPPNMHCQHREQMHKESYSALWSIRLGAVINQAN